MKFYDTCVVIPNWNGIDYLADCLDSLKSVSAHVVVVDNGSIDGSGDLVKNHYQGVELIELPANLGFAGGVNVGIKKSIDKGARYVALLNNDATVRKDWLENLVKTADKHPDTGIVTSKIVRSDREHLDSTGDFLSVWGLPFPRGRNQTDSGQYDTELEVFGASGGASLYRVGMLKEVGLFDEDFFAYFEDVDISFRAQLAGWKIRYEPQAVVYHKVGGTSSKLGNFARYHSTKNFVLLYIKDMPGWLSLKYLPLFFIQFLRLGSSSLVKGKILPFLRGVIVALKLVPRTLKKRRNIQSTRKVSVNHIDSILYHHKPPKLPQIEDGQ